MKSLKYILSRCLVGSLVLGLAACDLEEYNPGGATADAAWSTEQGFITAVNAAYHHQRNFYGKEDAMFMTESGTDLWFNQNKANYANQITRYEGLTPDAGNPNRNMWRIFYQAINQVNAGLERIGDVQFSSPAERARREGELRFLRGFYYWHIVETYGGVNLKLNETKGPELTARRSSVQEFYDVIISDLEFAAANLPNQSHWGPEYSRASKKSAYGFLARALLSRAYYASGEERTAYFTRARDVAKFIIDNKAALEVDLYANYAEVFDPENNRPDRARRNKEAMYIVSNSTDQLLNFDNNSNRLHLWYMTNYVGKPGLTQTLEYGQTNQQRLMPTRALLDFYDETKDSRYRDSFQEVWIANTDFTWTQSAMNTHRKRGDVLGKTLRAGQDVALVITKQKINEDVRFLPYIAIDRDSVYNADGTIRAGQNFVRLKKFHDPNRINATTQAGFRDLVVMRFAEMYLIAAEAEFQLGNTQAAADYINVLRTRAALPGKVQEMQVTSGDITLDFILDERARELAGEHIRWFDLKRTRTLVDRISRYNPDITAVQDFHMLRPVPQAEIDALLNGQEFGQNPEY